MTAAELLAATLDPGSWLSWDEPVSLDGLAEDYVTQLRAAAQKAGTDEAVITGYGLIRGRPVAMLVSEFRFLGGSIGQAAADRIVRAVRRATAERLPLIAATASGGTRMQEGTPAFLTMVDITRAIVAHKAGGLPYLVYLRHPTTGGVLASWASLGDVCVAEPGALIGFLGPGVIEALQGQPFPAGIQVAQNLAATGVIDAVVEPGHLADFAARVLSALSGPPGRTVAADTAAADTADTPAPFAGTGHDAWEAVSVTRRADRPGVRELLAHAAEDVVPLTGSHRGQDGDPMLIALARFAGMWCVVVGQDRHAQAAGRSLGPAAFRRVRRWVRTACRLSVPLVCVIDTPGAEISATAEQNGLAAEIASTLAEMVGVPTPTVSVLLGEGCGAAALALLPAQRVIAAENAWLAPLPPEGASFIVSGTTNRAPELAREQQVRSVDLLAMGVVHRIVPEQPPAHIDPAGFCRAVARQIAAAVGEQLAARKA